MKCFRFVLSALLVFCLAGPILPASVGAAPPPELTLVDGDLDQIYFPGNVIEFELDYFPAETSLLVSFWIEDPESGTVDSWPVIGGLEYSALWGWNMAVTTDTSGSATVSGIIADDLPIGTLSVGVYWDIFSVGFSDMMIVGVPTTYGPLNVNFDQLDNLNDPENQVVVTAPGIGAIAFDAGIEPVGFIQAFIFYGDSWISIEFDATENKYVVSVDTALATPLAAHGATIQLFGLAAKFDVTGLTADNFLDYLTFQVFDNDGALVTDFSDYFDLDNVSYNAASDTLTIPVNHFSDYVIGLRDLPVTGTPILWLLALALVLLVSGAWVVKKQFSH